MIEMELFQNRSSIDIRLHFYFEDVSVHSMNAEIFNECQREFINAIKQVNKYLPEKLEIEVAARNEGGLIDNILIVINHPMTIGIVIAFLTGFFTAQFRQKLSKKEERSLDITDTIKIKEAIAAGTFTETDFDNIAKKDRELRKRKSNFFKTAKKEKTLTQVEVDTTTLVNENPLFSKIAIPYKQFDDFILMDDNEEETPDTKEDDKARIFLIAPVLVKGIRTNWKGYYGGIPIDFTVSDKEFLEQIYSHDIKFENGTYIDCKLIAVTITKGEAIRPIITYTVVEVSELNDDKNFTKPIKHRKKEVETAGQGVLFFYEGESE